MKTKQLGLVFLSAAGLACLCLPVGRVVFLSDGAGITVLAGSNPPLAENVRPHTDGDVRLAENYGKLSLSFEVNAGQVGGEVKFLSRGRGYTLFLTGNEAVLSLKKPVQKANGKRQMANVAQRSPFNAAVFPGFFRPPAAQLGDDSPQRTATNNGPPPVGPGAWRALEPVRGSGPQGGPRTTNSVLRMKLLGADSTAKVVGLDELPGKSNYFIGNDPKKWRTNMPTYARVKYEGVYPGVDLVYYGNQGRLEYDFVVAPGADPGSIQLAIVSDEQVGSRQKAVGSETGAQDREPERQSAIDNRTSSIPVPLRIDGDGDLVVQAEGGEVRFHKPIVYQPIPDSSLRAPGLGVLNPKSKIQNI
jgi:hypothetical protein